MEEDAEEEIANIINEYYYDRHEGFLSAKKLYLRLRDDGHTITRAQVISFLNRIPQYTETQKPRKPIVFNSIVADTVGSNYQMDTMFMRNYKYRGYEYILVVIDVHSRYMAVCPMKTKEAKEYTKSFERIITYFMDGIWPQVLSADSEYTAKIFKDLITPHHVELRLAERGQPYKNAIVERVIRTFRTMIGRWRLGDPEGGVDWPEAIIGLCGNYNKTYHGTIKQKPIDVWLGKKPNNQVVRWVRNKLGVGDYVRYALRKRESNAWTKVDDLAWSEDIAQIDIPVGSRWKLRALPGKQLQYPNTLYMEYELKKVPWNEIPAETNNRRLVKQQRANSVVAQRLRKEDLGEVVEDVGGRPHIEANFGQLVLREAANQVEEEKPLRRKRRETRRYVPGEATNRKRARKQK